MDIKIGGTIVPINVQIVGDKIRVPSSPNKVIKKRFVDGFQKKVWRGGKPPNWNMSSMYYEAPLNSRNRWHLDFFNANTPNPYAKYRCDLEPFELQPRFSKLKGKFFDPMDHQETMASHVWTRRQCHIAAEMRTGKTLPVLSVIERLGKHAWYIAPDSALAGVKLEVYNWGFNLSISFMTYHELVSVLKQYSEDLQPPEIIVFDESHMIKNWDAQRTQAAFHVTEAMREKYENPVIVAMTGTPSPKNPTDFWSQIEVVRPGYLAETSTRELDERLSVIEWKDNETGGQYPNRICWKNSELICGECGELQEKHYPWEHAFVPCANEVKKFGERLKGISIKFRKRDCMQLPEKIYEMMELKPSRTILKYASQIKKSGQMPVTILNDLAQLSAGFYYEEVEDENNWVKCPRCLGSKKVENTEGELTETCTTCDGNGIVHPKIRQTCQIETPKEQAMIELLDEAEDAARFVAFGGFLGCIDRMTELAVRQGWNVIQVDGRGFNYFGIEFNNSMEALAAFSNTESYPDKLCVVAHPGTGGTGVSYSASPTIMYWHNPFDGAARMQSIERGTDASMDMSRGCRVVDLVCLPVDKYILDNLDKKTNLQSIAIEEL